MRFGLGTLGVFYLSLPGTSTVAVADSDDDQLAKNRDYAHSIILPPSPEHAYCAESARIRRLIAVSFAIFLSTKISSLGSLSLSRASPCPEEVHPDQVAGVDGDRSLNFKE